jgi:hypothetical protein
MAVAYSEMLARFLSLGEPGIGHTALAQRVKRYEFGLERELLTRLLAPESEILRPRDCSLDVSRTERRLVVRALDVAEGLRRLRTDYGL